MNGKLQDLNPIVLPDPVGWLPLAPGWKVLIALVALLLVVLAWRRWLSWRDQRYRREALREFSKLQDLTELPGLLKRTALSAWPREAVARLSGPAWHRFLDETAGLRQFTDGLGPRLDALAYGNTALSAEEEAQLRTAAHSWLQRHEAPSVSTESDAQSRSR